MKKLEKFVKRRREINHFYTRELEVLPGISFLKNPAPAFNSNHWLTCIIIEPMEAGYTREDLRFAMEAANIETRPLWKPMHLQPVFRDAAFYGSGVAEGLFSKGLCLPSGATLTNADFERIVSVFRKMSRNP